MLLRSVPYIVNLGVKVKIHLILFIVVFGLCFAQSNKLLSGYFGSVKKVLIEEESNNFKRRVKYDLFFNESGHLHESTFYSYNKDGSLELKAIKTYDQNGQPLNRQSLDVNEEPLYQTLYRYNESNLLIEEVIYNAEGNITGQMLHTYNEAGKEKLQEFHYKNTLLSSAESSYDSEGNLIKRTVVNADGMLLVETIVSEQGRVFERIDYFDGSGSLRTVTRLDEQGNVIESILHGSYIKTYEYNNAGLLLRASFEVDGSTTIDHYEYKFDAVGNWIKQIQLEDIKGVPKTKLTLYRTIEYY